MHDGPGTKSEDAACGDARDAHAARRANLEHRLQLRDEIMSACATQRVLPLLARRVAFQLTLKLMNMNWAIATWRAQGDQTAPRHRAL
jgi:hypothetical protein